MSLSEEPTWEPMTREHVTDGSPCWCDPVVEDYSGEETEETRDV